MQAVGIARDEVKGIGCAVDHIKSAGQRFIHALIGRIPYLRSHVIWIDLIESVIKRKIAPEIHFIDIVLGQAILCQIVDIAPHVFIGVG